MFLGGFSLRTYNQPVSAAMKGNIIKMRYCYSKSQTAVCKVWVSDTTNHIKKGRFHLLIQSIVLERV